MSSEIGYHLNSNKYSNDDYDADSEKIHHCSHLQQRSHLSRSPARHLSASPSPRKGSRSPLPAEHRLRQSIVQEHQSLLQRPASPLLQQSSLLQRPASPLLQRPPASPPLLRPPPSPRREGGGLKEKIEALEVTVAEYERQKFNVMGTFQEYRERVAERERKLEAEYSSKIISLSEEVLAAKKDFEERMKQFQALQEKFEREKETALEKLRQEHQREIQILEQRCSDTQLMNLEQKYILEIQRLEEERKSLRSDKERLSDAFDMRLKRAQSLYETELSSAKALYSNELDALKDHEAALREELLARQEEFRDRLEELNLHFQQSKEELAKCNKEVAELQERLKRKEEEVLAISQQLHDARKDTDEALEKLQKVEDELDSIKQKFGEKEEQLMRKSDMLNMLEQAKCKLEGLIQDLQHELKSLKNKVAFLENERQNLESQSKTQSQLQDSQLQALHSVLENLTKENQVLKEHYEQAIHDERTANEEKEFRLRKDFQAKFGELERRHKESQQHVELKISDARHKLRKELDSIYEQELSRLRTANETLETEVLELKHAKNSCPECPQLKKKLSSKEESLSEANTRVLDLNKLCDKLKADLEATKEEAEELKSHSSQPGDAANDSESTTESLQQKLEEEWKEKMRLMRAELEQQFEDERAAILEKQEAERAKSLEATKDEWLRAEEEHQAELDQLKSQLESLSANGDTEAVQSLNATVDELQATILRLTVETEELRKSKSLEMESEILNLRQELEAEKAEIARLKQAEAELTVVQNRLEEKEAEEARLREELIRAQNDVPVQMVVSTRVAGVDSCTQETITLQVFELQQKLEQKEKESIDHISSLERVVNERDEQIGRLDSSIEKLNSELIALSKEVELKNKDLSKLKAETQDYITKRERQQAKAHKRELDNVRAERDATKERFGQVEQQLRQQIDSLRKHVSSSETASAQADDDEIVQAATALDEQVADCNAATSSTTMSDAAEASEASAPQEASAAASASSTATGGEASKSSSSSSPSSPSEAPFSPLMESAASSPLGSMDNLMRKRDSISSTTSSKASSSAVSKQRSMSIVSKWHCLVHQLQDQHRHGHDSGSRRESLTSTTVPLIPKEKEPCSRAPSRDKSPVTASALRRKASGSGSRLLPSKECLSEGSEGEQQKPDGGKAHVHRHSRCEEKSSSSVLKPPESRRAGRSPARSPGPKPNLPIAKRPAWRI